MSTFLNMQAVDYQSFERVLTAVLVPFCEAYRVRAREFSSLISQFIGPDAAAIFLDTTTKIHNIITGIHSDFLAGAFGHIRDAEIGSKEKKSQFYKQMKAEITMLKRAMSQTTKGLFLRFSAWVDSVKDSPLYLGATKDEGHAVDNRITKFMSTFSGGGLTAIEQFVTKYEEKIDFHSKYLDLPSPLSGGPKKRKASPPGSEDKSLEKRARRAESTDRSKSIVDSLKDSTEKCFVAISLGIKEVKKAGDYAKQTLAKYKLFVDAKTLEGIELQLVEVLARTQSLLEIKLLILSKASKLGQRPDKLEIAQLVDLSTSVIEKLNSLGKRLDQYLKAQYEVVKACSHVPDDQDHDHDIKVFKIGYRAIVTKVEKLITGAMKSFQSGPTKLDLRKLSYKPRISFAQDASVKLFDRAGPAGLLKIMRPITSAEAVVSGGTTRVDHSGFRVSRDDKFFRLADFSKSSLAWRDLGKQAYAGVVPVDVPAAASKGILKAPGAK